MLIYHIYNYNVKWIINIIIIIYNQGWFSNSIQTSFLLLFKLNKASYWPIIQSPSNANCFGIIPSFLTSLISSEVKPLTIGSVAANSNLKTATTYPSFSFKITLGIVGSG